jgi:uncharacterized membrane protein (DUF2068 family)
MSTRKEQGRQEQEKRRPFGVTIIAILTIIGGIAFLASGITAVTVAPFLSGHSTISNSNAVTPATAGTLVTIPQTLLVGLSAGIGGALLALGIAYFVMAYGLLKGKGWAWTITLILSSIGIALGFVSIVTGHVGSIFTVIVNAVIVYYIYRPYVKSFFGKTMKAELTR